MATQTIDKESYNQGVRECLAVMNELFDELGDYSPAQEMYFKFRRQAKRMLM